MRHIVFSTLTLIIIIACVSSAYSNPVINEADAPKFLYTMSAKSGTYADGRLMLKDVPLVVYFSDRPHRISGQLSIEVFEQGWDKGAASLQADPPNATLSILGKGDDNNIVIEVSDPEVKVEEGEISFKVKILKGEMPASFGNSTLFVDAIPNVGLSGQVTD